MTGPSHPTPTPAPSNHDRLHRLNALLRIERPTEVVDIGANPIDGAPPYQTLLKAGLCNVTGFEPDPDALAALNMRKTARET